jgi:hypothetical protein
MPVGHQVADASKSTAGREMTAVVGGFYDVDLTGTAQCLAQLAEVDRGPRERSSEPVGGVDEEPQRRLSCSPSAS